MLLAEPAEIGMTVWRGIALVLLLASAGPAGAITGDEPPPPVDAAQDDYAAGLAAFEAGDWQAVIDRMAKVIEVRPWHADAYNRTGFAYRKLGDYDRALVFYEQALDLDPHHRGALEYLGEAYLELDRPDDAQALLERLATECRRVAAGDDWQSGCEEWEDLHEAYDAWRAAHSPAAASR
jgi:tetratricopeptide (TPR) repeat protein